MLPVLLTLILNSVNIGFFFLVALNVAVSPRAGALYAIMGFATPSGASSVPAVIDATTPTTVPFLAYEDMRGALAAYASATVQTCSKKVQPYINPGASNQRADCKTCTSSSDSSCTGTNVYTPTSDPESPGFVLHRVDVTYTFSTLIPGTAFNLVLPPGLCTAGTCIFHRQVSMRAMD